METLNIEPIKKIEKGMRIGYGVHASEYGNIMLFCTETGICGLHFFVKSPADHLQLAKQKFKQAIFVKDKKQVRTWWKRVKSGHSVGLSMHGTEFQLSVWEALTKIPKGMCVTYKGIAESLGMDRRYARAVASAVGKNFIAILVPCHRVVCTDGYIGGYRWGIEKKTMLLKKEQIQSSK